MHRNVLVLILFSILLSIKVVGQSKFIEVLVSDTVHLRPDVLIYKIGITHESEFIFDQITSEMKMLEKAGLLQLIQRLNLDTIVYQKPQFTLNTERFDQMKTASIRFTAYNQIYPIREALKKYSNVYAFIAEKESYRQVEGERRLTAKLIEAGRKKADMIAGFMNARVMGLESIIEIEREEDNTKGWTAYPPLSMLTNIYQSENDYASVVIRQKYKMKFSVE